LTEILIPVEAVAEETLHRVPVELEAVEMGQEQHLERAEHPIQEVVEAEVGVERQMEELAGLE
jgi:hypothetical protein